MPRSGESTPPLLESRCVRRPFPPIQSPNEVMKWTSFVRLVERRHPEFVLTSIVASTTPWCHLAPESHRRPLPPTANSEQCGSDEFSRICRRLSLRQFLDGSRPHCSLPVWETVEQLERLRLLPSPSCVSGQVGNDLEGEAAGAKYRGIALLLGVVNEIGQMRQDCVHRRRGLAGVADPVKQLGRRHDVIVEARAADKEPEPIWILGTPPANDGAARSSSIRMA